MIKDVTLGEASEILDFFKTKTRHPEFDGPVIAQFVGRFVFVCNMEIKEGYCYLTNVRNVRYWESRDNGLGALATHGKLPGDKIDDWPDQIIPVDKLGPIMQVNKDKW